MTSQAWAPARGLDTHGLSARRRSSLSRVAVLICCAALLAGATGVTLRLAFSQASDLKYALTVAGPLMLLAAAASKRPLDTLVATAVFMAPFSTFVVTVAGISISALTPFLVLSAIVALASEAVPGSPSRLTRAAPLILLLLLMPMALARSPLGQATLFLQFGVVVWLVMLTARHQAGRDQVVVAMVISGGLHGVLALWQFTTGHTLSLYSSDVGSGVYGNQYFFGYGGENRPSSVFSDPISLGNVLALTIPIGVAACLDLARRRRPWVAGLVAVATGAAALGLILTFSRTSWIGATVGLVVVVLGLPAGWRLSAAVSATGLALVLGSVAVATAGPDLGERFSSITDPTASSVRTADGDRTRLSLWSTALDVGRAHPVTGIGFGNIGRQLHEHVAATDDFTHAHSTYLQFFAEAGVGGVAALILLWGSALADLRRGWRRYPLAAGVAGASIAIVIFWATDYTVRYLAVAACIAPVLGLATSFGRDRTS